MDVHPTLPASPLSDGQQSAETSNNARRPKSQPPPSRRDRTTPKKRSPNDVGARPVNAAVISNMISSLEALATSPNGDSRNGQHGSYTRRRSSVEGARSNHSSLPAMSMTSSFGMEYGRRVSVDDDDGSSDAAMPPTIRMSRAPSERSEYSRSRSPSLSRNTNGRLRPASVTSRRGSWSGRSKEMAIVTAQEGKKLSAEGWNKSNRVSRESLESRGSMGIDRGGDIRRMSSYETFKQEKKMAIPEQIMERPDTSVSEEITIRTPPPLKAGKGRLFLTDTAIDEERMSSESPNSVIMRPEVVDSSRRTSTRPADSNKQPSHASMKVSPMQSPVTDSIPLRTSSLRQTRSPGGQKRKKEKKRSALGHSKERDHKSSPKARRNSLNETNWAELGEDDETVKRIRQLKQQREQRIRDSKDCAPLKTSQNKDEAPATASPAVPTESSDDIDHEERIRPAVTRASTDPPAKAHKLLGITSEHPATVSTARNRRPGSSSTGCNSPEQGRKRNQSLEVRKHAPSAVALVRPPTADSSTAHLSLDYSYTQAVDALQNAEREPVKAKRRSETPSAAKEQSPADEEYKRRIEAKARLLLQATSEPVKKSKASQRWTTNHHDVPLGMDRRKSRRKSMSDARNGNVADEEHEDLSRRDSIEDAVLEYLKDPRLSRKVRHGPTGRTISYSEVGDPKGAAVFVCVGMGLTRFVAVFYDELATTLRLRLITIDRPGVGGSDPYPAHDRTGPLSWPDDVLAICQELGIAKFSILAHSAGAIYALATALIMPQMVKGKVHLLAPWIPPSQLETISHPKSSAPPAGALPRSQRFLRVLPTPFLKAANSSFMNANSASLKPASKRQVKAAKDAQRQASVSPGRPTLDVRPTSPEASSNNTSNGPDYKRRQSMMTMDQDMPTIDPRAMGNLPFQLTQEDATRMAQSKTPRRSSVILSATASPTDPALNYAATALNAAEYAERERQIEYTSRLTQRTWELAIRDSNPATDLLVCLERYRDVGFRYTDVGVETVVTHGSEDKRVPLANVKWLAEQMNRRALVGHGADLEAKERVPPGTRNTWEGGVVGRGGCEVRVLQGEGHGLMASPFVMGECLTEIAGYWVGDAGKGRVGD